MILELGAFDNTICNFSVFQISNFNFTVEGLEGLFDEMFRHEVGGNHCCCEGFSDHLHVCGGGCVLCL